MSKYNAYIWKRPSPPQKNRCAHLFLVAQPPGASLCGCVAAGSVLLEALADDAGEQP